MCGVSPLFVYTMSQVQICACTRICIWRMYIIELLSEMVYKVYKSSRSQPTRLIIYEKVMKNPVNFTKNLLTTEVGTSILLKRARKGASIILLRKR